MKNQNGINSLRSSLVVGALALCSWAGVASAQAGQVDTSFGYWGFRMVNFEGDGDDVIQALAVQPDGKIVGAGYRQNMTGGNDFTLIRLTTAGNLDTTFGKAGRQMTDFARGSDRANAIAIQPDGRILAAGTTTTRNGATAYGVARYLSNGTLDTTFGTKGLVTVAFGGGSDKAFAVAVQSNGRVVVGGYASSSASSGGFGLARLMANGNLDMSFATSGLARLASGGSDTVSSVKIQSDGRILAAGTSLVSGRSVIMLARYDAAGSPDLSFGYRGVVTTSVGNSLGHAVVQLPNGSVLVGGSSDAMGQTDFALACYTSTGGPDMSFGIGGFLTTQIAGHTGGIAALALQADGKIVATGTIQGGRTDDFAVLRYAADGNLDSTFGTNGGTLIDVQGTIDVANAITIQADGKIVVGGMTAGTTMKDMFVTRLLAN